MILQPGINGAWLGATDIKTEGTFIWENSGNVLTYTNWAPGEPYNNGDCITMWCDHANGVWNDCPCSDTHQTTLCEVVYTCT